MKKILTVVLALLMLLSCVACSKNNTDPADGPNPPINDGTKPGQTDTPIELRPPVHYHGANPETDKKPFDRNDPRKKYLEDKYGVTAYLVAEKTPAALYSLFALEGYEGIFRLFARADLVASGAQEESITTDYVDDAYFTIAYAEIYAYFAQAIKASGVTADRMIVEYKGSQSFMYDQNKSFVEGLASAPNGAKRFNLTIYGNFSRGDAAIDKLLAELDKLDFTGQIEFRQVLQDISNVTNTDLQNDTASVYSEFSDRQRIQ